METNANPQNSDVAVPTDINKPEDQLIIYGSKSESQTFFKTTTWRLSYDFPWNPDTLCAGNNYDIYDEMIDDDQVKAVINIKKDMVLNTGWVINGESEKVNEFITEALENINRNSDIELTFDDSLRDILSSYEYGFSLTEPVYELEYGKYIYKYLKTRAPHSFKFYLDEKGKILNIEQDTPSKSIKFNPNVFIHHVYQPNFGNPYGKSDLRAAYPAYKSKKFFDKYYAMYIERFACPAVVGKVPKNYSPDQIEAFHNMLKSLQTASTFTTKDDVTIEFQQITHDATDAYMKGLNYYNMKIARSILVPDLMGFSGAQTGGGSYALGKEQFKVFLATIRRDRESLALKVTSRLVQPLVQANFGDIDCWFEFKPFTNEDIIEYLKVWVAAVQGKVFEPSDEEINYFRSASGFPEGEVTRVPQPINPLFPTQQAGGMIPKKKMPKEEPEEEMMIKKMIRRPLTTFEKKINFTKIKETLDESENKIIPKLAINARAINASMIDQIRDRSVVKRKDISVLETIKPKYQRDMKTTLRNYFIDLYKESYEDARAELIPETPKKFASPLLPDEFVDTIDAEAFKVVGDYSIRISQKTKNIVVQAIKDGYSTGETIDMLRSMYQDETDTWLNTVIRTKTTEIYNEARKQYWENDEYASQVVEAYQWSAILDDRTSDICRYLDGKIYEVGELADSLKPPAHFNCRSVLVPITKFEEYTTTPLSELNLDKLTDMGGGLLKPYSREIKKQTVEMNTSGESFLIAGSNEVISILGIFISNLDNDKPVEIALRPEKSIDFQYRKLIAKGDNFKVPLVKSWGLLKNEGLIINLSANVRISCTIEYEVDNAEIPVKTAD